MNNINVLNFNSFSNQTFIFTNLYECINSFFNLFFSMCSRKLTSDSCLSLWYNWEAESNNINIMLFHHRISHISSKSGITKIYWSNRTVIMTQDVETSLLHLCSEQCSVGLKILDEILIFTEHLEDL